MVTRQALQVSEPPACFDAWLGQGRDLANRKVGLDWEIADWIAEGKSNFPDQVQEALPGIIDDTRQIGRMAKTALAFPKPLRDPKLTFDHYVHVADLPVQEALSLLKEAHTRNMTSRALRLQAMDRKIEIGQILPAEDDYEYDCAAAIYRAWNRAPLIVRQDAAERIAESGYGPIEP